MKILNFGLELALGKVKYIDDGFKGLVAKYKPKKEVPYGVEFIEDGFDLAAAIVYPPEKKLDLIVVDLEKIEKRLEKVTDSTERAYLENAQKLLEAETLLCDAQLSAEQEKLFKTLMLITVKPCLAVAQLESTNSLISAVLAKAKVLLFFTAGEKEVHAWDILKGDTAVTAAGRIHSDLARGFIKAEIINVSQLGQFHNINEARSRGLVKVVDRDYLMEPGDIIEVRFSV